MKLIVIKNCRQTVYEIEQIKIYKNSLSFNYNDKAITINIEDGLTYWIINK